MWKSDIFSIASITNSYVMSISSCHINDFFFFNLNNGLLHSHLIFSSDKSCLLQSILILSHTALSSFVVLTSSEDKPYLSLNWIFNSQTLYF